MTVRTIGRTVAMVALLGSIVIAVPGLASSAAPRARPEAANQHVKLHSAHGVHVISTKRISARQLLATIRPKALDRHITVRILLPVGYSATGSRRYPVLYLFPGTSGSSADWMTVGQAPKATRRYPLITVSSDIGFNGDGGGWFTNWVDRTTKLGKSQWETYDIHELIPWIDANLSTIDSRRGRAVAGLSQGGYGSTELAARHPDLFTQLAAFSGAPEIERDLTVREGAALIIAGTMVGLNGVQANAPFGAHGTDEINWAGHDPANQIPNLRGMGLWFATADGLPGKYDDPVTNPGGAVGAGFIESLTHVSTDTFLRHLKQAGLPATVFDYGTGTHSWPYWARDLRHFLSPLMHRFAHPVARPAKLTYISIEPHWSQWGWGFTVRRKKPLQFERLINADADGFLLSGSGTAIVTTPSDFAPHRRYVVRVGQRRLSLVSNADGRLPIVVPLGASVSQVRVRITH